MASSENRDLFSSSEAPSNRFLGKRSLRVESLNLDRVVLEQDFRTDNRFLMKFWHHHESEKGSKGSGSLRSFDKFKSSFLKLCEADLFFCRKISLLYKFILTHRYEHMNETKMRYERILDNDTEQPNWIYDLNNPHMKPQKISKEIQEGHRLEINRLFSDYNFTTPNDKKIDRLLECFEGDHGSSKEPIEIL